LLTEESTEVQRYMRPAETRWAQEHEEWWILAGIPIHYTHLWISKKVESEMFDEAAIQANHQLALMNYNYNRHFDEPIDLKRIERVIAFTLNNLPRVRILIPDILVVYDGKIPYWSTDKYCRKTMLVDDARHGELIGSTICLR
jgi:hypothetical protein